MATKPKKKKFVFDMQLEYVMKQCGKVGTYTMNHTEFKNIFNGEPDAEMKRIEDFCGSRGMELAVNQKKKTFTFTLLEYSGE